tara:strand:+ start:1636 stop:1857 length:222 start_codon:yes stop_codon:yes gene_type:complete
VIPLLSQPGKLSGKLQLQAIQFSGGRATKETDGIKRSRFSEEQIIANPKSLQKGAQTFVEIRSVKSNSVAVLL